MPIIISKGLPVAKGLREEGVAVLEQTPQGVKPLRVMFLNIMPVKQPTEIDFFKAIAQSPFYVEMVLTKISGLKYKNTPQEYMDTYYTDFEKLRDEHFDGFIVTGAPLDHIDYEEVNYWGKISEIFSWARANVRASLYVCWGALAGLYYHFGINKHWMEHKTVGVYSQTVLCPKLPLFRGFNPRFAMPNSRQTEVWHSEIDKQDALTVASEAPETGITICVARGGQEIFTLGHLEYADDTLNNEYQRDKKKGIEAVRPENYYADNDEAKGVDVTWRAHSQLFYMNWIHYYVAGQE